MNPAWFLNFCTVAWFLRYVLALEYRNALPSAACVSPAGLGGSSVTPGPPHACSTPLTCPHCILDLSGSTIVENGNGAVEEQVFEVLRGQCPLRALGKHLIMLGGRCQDRELAIRRRACLPGTWTYAQPKYLPLCLPEIQDQKRAFFLWKFALLPHPPPGRN